MLKYPDLQHKYNQTQQIGFCSLASSTSETKARSGVFFSLNYFKIFNLIFCVCLCDLGQILFVFASKTWQPIYDQSELQIAIAKLVSSANVG